MNTNQLIKVEEITGLVHTAPEILTKNQNSVARCKDAGQSLLDTIEGLGEINSDELDTKVSDFISKAKITVKNMNTRRSPLTQLLTRISKEFTTLENEINPTTKDSIPAKLQEYRDNYAAKKLAEQKAIEEAERKRQAKENEKLEYKTDLTLSMQKHFTQYFEEQAIKLENLFAGLTLANFDKQSKEVAEFSTEYNAAEHFKGFKDNYRPVYLEKADIDKIKMAVVPTLMKDYTMRFRNDIQRMKDDLVIRLASKRKDFERIDELKKQDADAAARAQEVARIREEEEKKKREEEQRKREQEEKLRLEAQAAQADIFNSFGATAAAAPTTTANAKVTKKIKVNNAKGFLEVYQMWFIGEGAKLSIEELEKIHKKMITFCEKKANKDEEFIQSAFVEYIDDVKAK